MGYSPWGCKESDMNKQITLSLSLLYPSFLIRIILCLVL